VSYIDRIEVPETASNPRIVIRGSECATGGVESPDPLAVSAAFDWYQATVPTGIDGLLTAFVAAFGGEWQEGRPKNGYAFGRQHPGTGAEVWWGGQNPHPHIKASGAVSQAVADWLRATFPRHRVARADVALDFAFAGAFDALRAAMEPVARQAGVACTFLGDLRENTPDPSVPRKGRTCYLGAKSSDVRVRLYEKGWEQAARGNPNAPKDWVRVEVVVRPQKSRKTQAATLDPFALIGFSKWASRAVGAVLECSPAPIPNPDKRVKPVEHSLDAMARQYGGRIREFVEAHGWHELSAFLYLAVYTAKERGEMEAACPVHLDPTDA
jgi:hypothetical protein